MSQITTHVLDITRGSPAQELPITLSAHSDGAWHELASGVTNSDGRIAGLLADEVQLKAGIYRMHFDTGSYFKANSEKGFYPFVDIVFELDGSNSHYHIPLLLSAFGYSTYRGS
ncbi:hydroxyisourate hydrolase [Shewanella eurypsychrophilus]|uniref:5-hydroxyisourate hydrolase n=1 Tax=Shewanella eurypsychrophilus TaxID=2593656 RepID=A0ABX6V7M5_9GAMM|nr:MULTISPECIES: hydroxyisourate hydrolase [Shewanella]QFU22711.1 hydroxyisourate hydrolase [Shewanella sp. YLB-09]QPG58000.1 hydroxyisourate hydrolase [Shewanella eurypsychrophilus]